MEPLGSIFLFYQLWLTYQQAVIQAEPNTTLPDISLAFAAFDCINDLSR